MAKPPWDASRLPGPPPCLQPAAPYDYPDDTDPDVQRVKRCAARFGRCFGRNDRAGCAKHFDKLVEIIRDLPRRSQLYWRQVVMIDHRWCGATGQGAYWAVASEAVNNAAAKVLGEGNGVQAQPRAVNRA